MSEIKEYVYDIEEYSQDVRHYQVTSNVKLTDEEVRSVYMECSSDNLAEYVDWSDKRFSDDEFDKIKISCVFDGTEYGDDCQVDVFGEFEND